MKKLNSIMLALGAAAAFGATGLYAQTRAVANVPFDFTVQTANMPAGQYALQTLPGPSGVIQIINNKTGKSVLVLAPTAHSTYMGKESESGKIIFHRYGDQYFFSEVWTANGPRGRTEPPKLERELRASTAGTEMASVNIPLTGAQ